MLDEFPKYIYIKTTIYLKCSSVNLIPPSLHLPHLVLFPFLQQLLDRREVLEDTNVSYLFNFILLSFLVAKEKKKKNSPACPIPTQHPIPSPPGTRSCRTQ